ncbi:baseplate protein, partial [Thermus thermophilus]|uniref:T4 family baseplate hub assembly chaperone n=1 Tax=Thermus thermophilus TaxID=274 RepID=UPI0013FD4E0C|nr:baseplate protein [Thermus thermophilus]
LATYDIEYLFLQIRTKSVGENVDVMVTCPDDGETEVEISIPLDDIKVVKTRGHKKELKLDDEIAVTMGYPNLESFVESNFGEDTNQIEQIFEMAAGCIETIADTNQIYECKDLPKSEILEFLDQLSSKQFGELQKFFETMPKLSHTVQVTNPNTGVESEVVLEGLASFFA